MRTRTPPSITILVTFILGILFASLVDGREAAESGGASSERDVEIVRQQVVAANAMAKQGDAKGAAKVLASAIESERFSKLDETSRYRVLSLTGSLFLELRDLKQAGRYLGQATEMGPATLSDWYGRLIVSSSKGDLEDSAKSLIHIASHWPKGAKDLPEKMIAPILLKMKDDASSSDRYFQVLDSLSRTDWPKVRFWADNLWKQLVLFHLNDGNQSRAQEVAARISSPDTLIQMRVNKKYAVLVAAHPERFDIQEAIRAHIAYSRTLVNAEPNSLEKVNLLLMALKEARKYEEVLELATRAIETAMSTPKNFGDTRENLSWTMELKASALVALNRPGWIDLMKKAATIPEGRSRNVSQAINLGLMHCWFGDANLARGAIRQLSTDIVSAYGKVMLEGVRVCADIIEENRYEVDRKLAAMREQRRIAPEAYRNSLLRANKLEEAAAFIQEALSDPKLQDEMLFKLQEFKPGTAGLPLADAVDDRLIEVVKRPDVRRAIEAIGRIESFDFDP